MLNQNEGFIQNPVLRAKELYKNHRNIKGIGRNTEKDFFFFFSIFIDTEQLKNVKTKKASINANAQKRFLVENWDLFAQFVMKMILQLHQPFSYIKRHTNL